MNGGIIAFIISAVILSAIVSITVLGALKSKKEKRTEKEEINTENVFQDVPKKVNLIKKIKFVSIIVMAITIILNTIVLNMDIFPGKYVCSYEGRSSAIYFDNSSRGFYKFNGTVGYYQHIDKNPSLGLESDAIVLRSFENANYSSPYEKTSVFKLKKYESNKVLVYKCDVAITIQFTFVFIYVISFFLLIYSSFKERQRKRN